MKRIIISILAAAAMAASCHKYQVDAPITPISGPEVTVTISSVGDSTFTVTLVPNVTDDDIQFYSCYIYQSDIPVNLDSCALYQCQYKADSNAVYAGTVKYAEFQSDTIVLLGLTPNTTYQIAAVAGSAMGVPGKITGKEVLTTDSTRPNADTKNYSNDSVSVTVKFDRDIHLATENAAAKAYATYKKVWDPDDESTGGEAIKFEVDSIVVDGNTMTLFAPKKIDGAYVFFTWDAGLVKSDVDSACAAFKTVKFFAEKGKIVADSTKGIYTRIDPTTFGLTRVSWNGTKQKYEEVGEDSVIAFMSNEEIAYLLQADNDLATENLEDITVSYKSAKKTSIYHSCECDTAERNIIELYRNASDTVSKGEYLNYFIEEDSFEDIWGNYNEEYENEDNYLSSYGYTVEDFCGTYAVSQYSYAINYYSLQLTNPFSDTIYIKQIDKDTVSVIGFGVHNELFTEHYELKDISPVKAVVDTIIGTLTFSAKESIGKINISNTAVPKWVDLTMANDGDSKDNLYLQLSMPISQHYETEQLLYGYDDGNGWGYIDVSLNVSFKRVTPELEYPIAEIFQAKSKTANKNSSFVKKIFAQGINL